MKKVLLDFSIPDSKAATHAYLAEQLGFSDHYGKNLDALYDELTSISEPTAVGIFMPVGDMMDLDFDLMIFLDSVCEVFTDAESCNSSLAVIFGDLMANPEYEDVYDDLIDSYVKDDYADDDSFSEDMDEELMKMGLGDKDVLVLDIGR